MAAGPTGKLKSEGRWIAVAVSLGLHGIAIYALASEPWSGFDQRSPIRTNLVFVSAPTPPPVPLPEDLPVPDPRRPTPALEPEPEVARTAEVPDIRAESQRSTTDEPPDRPIEEQQPADDAEVTPDRRPVDYDELGRRTVRAYLDRIEREQQPRRFGGDDRADVGLSSGGASPRSVFESGPNSRAALRPTKARSRFVRRVATICNELTGGFSLFGIIGLCTDGNVRSDLLAEVKPGYLDEVPECEEVELTAAGQAIVAIGEFGATAAVADINESGIATAIKCRLVNREEIFDAQIGPAGTD